MCTNAHCFSYARMRQRTWYTGYGAQLLPCISGHAAVFYMWGMCGSTACGFTSHDRRSTYTRKLPSMVYQHVPCLWVAVCCGRPSSCDVSGVTSDRWR